ncbi:hypothetical protein [Rhizobium mesoamericanum]|uniref:hypothetical protein n=1 Tax=Rhizobium mesoamericanum TaxID=1079800 RepID=UPI000490E46F|nr:hypothetical protein [Rhizobium mesoamericanum]
MFARTARQAPAGLTHRPPAQRLCFIARLPRPDPIATLKTLVPMSAVAMRKILATIDEHVPLKANEDPTMLSERDNNNEANPVDDAMAWHGGYTRATIEAF